MFLLIIFVDYICNFQLFKVCFCNYEVEVIVHKHTYTRADAFEITFEIKILIGVTAIFRTIVCLTRVWKPLFPFFCD